MLFQVQGSVERAWTDRKSWVVQYLLSNIDCGREWGCVRIREPCLQGRLSFMSAVFTSVLNFFRMVDAVETN